MNTKPWYRSRTLLLNLLALLLAVGSAAEPLLPSVQGMLPANLYVCIAFGLPIANAVLRVITTQGLSLAAQKE